MRKVFFLFILILGINSCKKKTQQPSEPVIQETQSPPPKGNLDGTWKWLSGDSATADLVLSTHDLNYQLIYPVYLKVDRYIPSILMFRNDGEGKYYQTQANYNIDTIKIFHNLKWYRYIRK